MGPLPVVNHFIERIGLEDLLARHIPSDARCAVPHAQALGVLLRSLIVEREPISRVPSSVYPASRNMSMRSGSCRSTMNFARELC